MSSSGSLQPMPCQVTHVHNLAAVKNTIYTIRMFYLKRI